MKLKDTREKAMKQTQVKNKNSIQAIVSVKL